MAMSFTEWLPVLQVGNKQIFQQSVDIRGDRNAKPNLAAQSAAPAPPGGFSGGFDALAGGDPAPDDDGRFTGEWLEYEIRTPGARPQTVRREIFDLLLPSERSAKSVPAEDDGKRLTRSLSLLGSVQLLIQTSLLVPEFALERAMAETVANRQAMAKLAKELKSGSREVNLAAEEPMSPTSDPLHSLAIARFAWSPVGANVFIASPNILTYRRSVTQSSEGHLVAREGFDIVTNAVQLRQGAPDQSFVTQVRQGTADTNVEAMLLKASDSASNAGSTLAGQLQPQLLSIRSIQDLDQLGRPWPEPGRTLISEALQAGYVVIVSKTQDTPGRPPTWWRIDPRTGETLGIGPDGWGQGMVEHALTVMTISVVSVTQVTLMSAVLVYNLCVIGKLVKNGSLPPPEEDRVCRCEALDTGVVWGGGAGGIVGAGVGIAFPYVGFIMGTTAVLYAAALQTVKALACAI
jgi:hypothetical protein